MNDQGENGIDWCDTTWNPVAGCTARCGATAERPQGWCYARKMAARIGHLCKQFLTAREVDDYGLDPDKSLCAQFWPHLHSERLKQVTPRQKPARVFVGSMCDLWDPMVPPDWRARVYATMKASPQHVYLILTKRPDMLTGYDKTQFLGQRNWWLGVSVTGTRDQHRVPRYFHSDSDGIVRWASYEPMLGDLLLPVDHSLEWLVMGAESGAGAVVPEREWVERMVTEHAEGGWHDMPVFLKRSLAAVMGEEYVRAHQDMPEDMRAVVEARRGGTDS
jgi:protein gp37